MTRPEWRPRSTQTPRGGPRWLRSRRTAVAFTAAAVTVVALYAAGGVKGGRSGAPAAAPAGAAPAAGAAVVPLSARSREAQLLREWLSRPVVPVGRNLFAPVTPTVRENQGTLAKSPPDPSDATQQQQRSGGLRQGPAALPAGTLAVQSTLMGPVPTAVINGRVVREGDVVASGVGGPAGAGGGRVAASPTGRAEGSTETERAGAGAGLYRVLRIEPRRVIVEHMGVALEIPMDRSHD